MGIKQDATPCGGMGRDAPHGSHDLRNEVPVKIEGTFKNGQTTTLALADDSYGVKIKAVIE